MRSRPRSRAHMRTALIGIAALTASLLPAHAASAAQTQAVTITTDRAIYLAAEGSRVEIGVKMTTSDGRPLVAARTVDYATTAGTATAGLDHVGTAGTLRYEAGSPSGSSQPFTVTLRRDQSPETAETIPISLTSTAGGTAVAEQPTVVVNANGLPYLDPALSVDQRVADLLRRMTLPEKIGQMTQAERGAIADDPSLVAEWMLGSVLSGGGSTPATNTPVAWVQMVNDFQEQALNTRLQIPLIYGIDAVHGHGNVHGATIFPHNIGLGSTRDPALIEQVGHATAEEVRATGIPWNFGPCVCVARDERWGRTYESFGEDPALVVSMESIIDGLQGTRPSQLDDQDRVLSTAKHYAGDGDTEYDYAVAAANEGKPWWEQRYTIDQGVTVSSREDFARIDLAPYVSAVGRHGVGSVMPSFSSVDWTEDGVGNPTKMHAHRELITDVLKAQIGFDGFLISDWEGIHQIPDPDNPTNGGLTAYKVRVGVNAGTDMFMEPYSAKQFEDLLLAEVRARTVSRERIDDAVRRILAKKFELGLFEQPYASADRLGQVGSSAHRAIARQAVAESQVLLKNDANLLPLRSNAKVYVAGRNADDIGNQAGGWTIQWQGVSGDIIPGTTILEGIREVAPQAAVTYSADASAPISGSDVGVVVVGETPYAEGYGDIGGPECGWCSPPQHEEKSLSLQPGDKAIIDKVCGAVSKCVVLVVSGRPQVVTDQLGEIDALVASWLPGSEGAGVADVLFGKRPFTGQLSMTWPRTEAQVPINVGDANYQPLYPFGWGLRTDSTRSRLSAAATALRGEPAVSRAMLDVNAALGGLNWNGDGSVKDKANVVRLLGSALAALKGATVDTVQLERAIVSVARDVAQAGAVGGGAPANWAALIADADHALLTGDAAEAYALLVRAAG
ncbi:MAG TPA: glycoside hydrolase family 3 protein [Jiangellales bacterium]|nr:glycoside hydrolase family 3 protein [Jiangellales bacterium]